jgi:hypothetical protein
VSWQYGDFHFYQPSVRVSQFGKRCAGQVDATLQPFGWAAIIHANDHKPWPKLDAYASAEWDTPHSARHIAWLERLAGCGEIPSTFVAVPTSGDGDSRRGSGVGARYDPCEYAHAGYDGE